MKRYQELIRKLLEWSEQQTTRTPQSPPEISGYTPDQVQYHVGLCGEAGYLRVQEMAEGQYVIRCLTWEGHEALAKMHTSAA